MIRIAAGRSVCAAIASLTELPVGQESNPLTWHQLNQVLITVFGKQMPEIGIGTILERRKGDKGLRRTRTRIDILKNRTEFRAGNSWHESATAQRYH
jgi:hypothetical protein